MDNVIVNGVAWKLDQSDMRLIQITWGLFHEALLNLRNFEVIVLVSNNICFESKTVLMYQDATN